LAFSEALHDETEDKVAIFIDRVKCFDMVVPEVSLNIAAAVGLPATITRAVTGFYTQQVKFFKINGYYGSQVLSCNSAIQGCSMSVMMVNVMYSVLIRSLQHSNPNISITTFIDDCKIWGPQSFSNELVAAFNEIATFDTAVGQSLNEQKSEILARSKEKGRCFRRKLGKQFKIVTQSKSLGRVHQINTVRNAKAQEKRVKKALGVLSKIKTLPIPRHQKGHFIQSHAHYKWVLVLKPRGYQ
jgi:hypothetical protein